MDSRQLFDQHLVVVLSRYLVWNYEYLVNLKRMSDENRLKKVWDTVAELRFVGTHTLSILLEFVLTSFLHRHGFGDITLVLDLPLKHYPS